MPLLQGFSHRIVYLKDRYWFASCIALRTIMFPPELFKVLLVITSMLPDQLYDMWWMKSLHASVACQANLQLHP